jgi:endonuclease-3 related protein
VAVDRGFSEPRLREVYQLLLGAYGRQHWWPAESRFEVMVGAVLTQNAAWSNVERAIANLRAADWLRPEPIAAAAPAALAELIRPAGYFNVKARRLQSFCRFLLEQGGEGALAGRPTSELRHQLLRVHGVGPETADDMLLYAFERPVFVIDAYTRRIFARLGLIAGDESYEGLRAGFETALGPDAPLYNEYHALIVRHAKEDCRKRPWCGGCRLHGLCPRGQAESAISPDVR